jgi:RNA polymerase sigma-70 factor (ECF subfamily)
VDYTTISPEDLVLACLNNGEDAAWVEFIRRFQPLIAGVVLRVCRQWAQSSPQLIDDLVQETYLKLCADRFRLLRAFRPCHKDAMYGYIKVFAANLARDYFKTAHAQKRGGTTGTDSLDAETVRETVVKRTSLSETLERKLIIEKVAGLLATGTTGPSAERDRQIFWLYYRVGLTASGIASLPKFGLSTKGVESILLRLTRQVRQQLAPQKGRASERDRLEGIQSAESL